MSKIPENRIKLRNKICAQLQDWEERLGVHNVRIDPTPASPFGRNKLFHRFIRGIAKDGRSLLIYPIISRTEQMPIAICEEMEAADAAGAIVGCADGISDAWDIVFCDELEYPRKQKSYRYKWWGARYRKRREDGSSKK